MTNFTPQSTISTNKVTDINYSFALSALTSLFFLWGFITCLNDILIPHLKSLFLLNYTQAMLIQFCFFTAYFVMSLPSGILVEKLGYKRGIVLGLLVASLGCFIFYPAAGHRSYELFLVALFVLASGITLLQVAANPFVTILGRPESSSSRLNLTQAFNSLGTTLAPQFGSILILSIAIKSSSEIGALSSTDLAVYQETQAAAVQQPYLILASMFFCIAIVFSIIKLPKVEIAAEANEIKTGSSSRQSSAWKYPHLILGAIGIFFYVGAEVSIGSFLVSFLGEKHIAAMSESEAAKYISFYWGGAMVGRFIGFVVLKKVDASKVLLAASLLAVFLVTLTIFGSGTQAMWFLLSVGLVNSVMFPIIFSLGVQGLGKHSSQGSGILCMAIVGGAIVPLGQGVLADLVGLQLSFTLPVLCYCYIAYYGWRMSKSTRTLNVS